MTYDVVVIGAGVFGTWTAHKLRLQGASVLLLDSYGPGNSRASSGGESRIIRLGYGPDEIYSRSAQHSLTLWQELFAKRDNLFVKTGILWLAHRQDAYCEATLATLQKLGANHERLDRNELDRRYPELTLDPKVDWGILEPDSGALIARRAVQAIVAEARSIGVDYLQEAVNAPATSGKLKSIRTVSGNEIDGDQFVFACGPWLPKLFPELLGELIHVTRQEIFFFGVPPGDESFNLGVLPAW